jgi:hypothetical protein
MIQCGLASGHKVWYLATEGKEWREKFTQLLRQMDTGTPVHAPSPKPMDDLTSITNALGWGAGLSINRGGGRESKRRGVKLLFLDTDDIERNSIEGTPRPQPTGHLLFCFSYPPFGTQGRGMP